MHIQIDTHTLLRAAERGTTEKEIIEVLNSGSPVEGKYGRQGKGKVFDFKNHRFGKYYEQKRVEVYYLVEGDKMITVTVYVFYGTWEGQDERSIQ